MKEMKKEQRILGIKIIVVKEVVIEEIVKVMNRHRRKCGWRVRTNIKEREREILN